MSALGLGLVMRVGVAIVAAHGYSILVSSGVRVVFTALRPIQAAREPANVR